MHRLAGIVLAGGTSRRMGQDKAALDWHGTPLLVRVAGVLLRTVDGPVVVVARPGQPLPQLGRRVDVVRDPEPGLGPLAGLATGLAAVGRSAEAAFATATDSPFLHPALVRRVAGLRGAAAAAVPLVGGRAQLLSSVVSCACAEPAAALLGTGERRLGALFESLDRREIDEPTLLADPLLARVDPHLASVESLDRAEELAARLARPAPAVSVETHAGRTGVRAWTLAGALGHVVLGAEVDGRPWPARWPLPLVEGDAILVADARASVRSAA